MSIRVPRLDTVDFESLVEESRGRIPGYAPEWTDHNLHDPGITLLELLAWVTDQQVYQVGLVGEEHRKAFARLLGVEPRRALAARGLLWPQTSVPFETDLPPAISVRAVEGADVPYILDMGCRLSAAQPVSLVGHRGDSGPLNLLESGRGDRASFPAHRDSDGGLDGIQLSFDRPILKQGTAGAATSLVALGIEIENPALRPGAEVGKAPLWGPLVVDYRVAGTSWRPLMIVRDDTRALLQSGILALDVPAIPFDGSSELRLRLDRGFFPSAPRISRIELNVLPVIQLEHRQAALIQPGTGLPNQRQELNLKGRTVESEIAPDIRVEVAETGGWEHWQETDSLRQLGPEDRRVLVDAEKNRIRFGNGVNGKVPPLGAQIRHGTYALTLGAAGSVRAGLTWQVEGRGSTTWYNPAPLAGGEDAWDAERTGLEAQRLVHRPKIFLADELIRDWLVALPGFAIARVQVLPWFHPSLPGQRLQGHRTIVVVPEIMRDRDLLEHEESRYLDELRARMVGRQLAGERYHLMLAGCVPVRVSARLLVDPDASAAQVERQALRLLADRLTPLPPSGALEKSVWPMGRTLRPTRLSGLLAGVPGVVAVTDVSFGTGEDLTLGAYEVPLAATEVPRGRSHSVEIVRARGESDAA